MQTFITLFFWGLLFEYEGKYKLYMSVYRHGGVCLLIWIDTFLSMSNPRFFSLIYTGAFMTCYSILHFVVVQFVNHQIYATDKKWSSIKNCKAQKPIYIFSSYLLGDYWIRSGSVHGGQPWCPRNKKDDPKICRRGGRRGSKGQQSHNKRGRKYLRG